ncbi:exonuclease IX [Yersinia frederiksenii ATCC 33641]|nr:exonuclease IX [Yersinia frederiksenii]EEQ16150.1 exonuclease IX [Yersinia frederiksenii ATCC 33641]
MNAANQVKGINNKKVNLHDLSYLKVASSLSQSDVEQRQPEGLALPGEV